MRKWRVGDREETVLVRASAVGPADWISDHSRRLPFPDIPVLTLPTLSLPYPARLVPPPFFFCPSAPKARPNSLRSLLAGFWLARYPLTSKNLPSSGI